MSAPATPAPEQIEAAYRETTGTKKKAEKDNTNIKKKSEIK
jgi:hypothetical protein